MNELKKIAKDLKAYTDYGHFCYNEISLYYVLAYRIARFAFLLKPKILGMLLKLLSYPPYYLLSIITGIQIPLTVEVGEGLRIRHFGCIIINPSSVIGKNVTILHGVTLGIRRPNEGAPTIKDNVYVGAGAKLLGGVIVGNNAIIGANAVVLKNVPDGTTAVGVPAQIKYKK